jgi:hypothetical protein
MSYIKNTLPLVDYNLLPPNTTSILQPLDVGINRSIKCGIKNEYIDWLIKSFKKKSTLLKINKLRRNILLINWTINSWKNIKNDMIKKSFESCGYGNNKNVVPIWEIELSSR